MSAVSAAITTRTFFAVQQPLQQTIPDPSSIMTTLQPYETTEYIPCLTNDKRRACCCSQDYCKGLTRAFQALNDQRGRFVQVPVSSTGQNRHAFILRLQTRWGVHIPELQVTDFFDFRHSKKGDPKQVRRAVFVALHHFHPFVIHASVKYPDLSTSQPVFKFRRTISKTEVQSRIPNYEDYFSSEDVFEDGDYIVSPNYGPTATIEDLKRLQFVLRGRKRAAAEEARADGNFEMAPSEAKRLRRDPSEAIHEIHRLREALIATWQELKRAEALTDISKVHERQRSEEVKISSSVLDALTGPHGGWNRLAFVSKRWHTAHPKQARIMYGFKSWEETCQVVQVTFGLRPPEATVQLLQKPLTDFEGCLIAKLYGQQKADMKTIGVYYGYTQAYMKLVITKWTPRWVSAGLMELQEAPAPVAAV